MRNITGFLIRKMRLEKNYSQEGLCKGICAVSYLSKIEKGSVEPSREIIERLFAALGIDFVQDEAFVSDMRQVFDTFFDRYFHWESVDREQAVLDAAADRLENSTLYILYVLYRIVLLHQAEEMEQGRALLASLVPVEGYMDRITAFRYAIAQCLVLEEDAVKRAAVERAQALNPCSFSFYLGALYWYHWGRYQEALSEIAQGYRLAVEEGDVRFMRELSFLEGNCYANLFNRDLMMRAFTRCKALGRGDVSWQAEIDYNIGATLLEMRRFEEAMPYLRNAYTNREERPFARFLSCHKLAIAYEALDRKEEGRPYLDEAISLLPQVEPFYAKVIEVVRMRYVPGYQDREAYLQLLREVYDGMLDVASFGFKQFHGLYLMEAYKHRRKYKEALAVATEINRPLS